MCVKPSQPLALNLKWVYKCDCGWGLTAVEVYEKDPFQVFVVDQGSMDTWAWLMVDGEVAPVGVPAKQVVLLFIYDQFLQGETVSVIRGL